MTRSLLEKTVVTSKNSKFIAEAFSNKNKKIVARYDKTRIRTARKRLADPSQKEQIAKIWGE